MIVKLSILLLLTMITLSTSQSTGDPTEDPADESDASATGKLVANFHNDSQQNPEELGLYFDGDIQYDPEDTENWSGLTDRRRLWSKAIIPYDLRGNFSDEELRIIEWAVVQFKQKTCIKFVPRSKQKDYVSITSEPTGCWSYVGRKGGRQIVNLQTPGCLLRRGTVLHELMHAIGFLHEHSRYDRDIYIQLLQENIQKRYKSAFQKYPKGYANGRGVRYDYASVMHYSTMAFSANMRPTIKAKLDTEEAKRMGQRSDFTHNDVIKLNRIYKCLSGEDGLTESGKLA